MATYFKPANFIYFASPGTGSTSVEYALLEQLESTFIEGDDALFKYGKRHAQYSELRNLKEQGIFLENNILSEINFDSLISITSVRNPFAYFYADWYRNKTKWMKELEKPDSWIYDQPNKIRQIVKACSMEFSDWLVDQLGHIDVKSTKIHLNREYTDFAELFIRMEHMEEDLEMVSNKLNLENSLKPLSLNMTERGNDRGEYWQFYSKQARELIESIYLPTLTKFGYRF